MNLVVPKLLNGSTLHVDENHIRNLDERSANDNEVKEDFVPGSTSCANYTKEQEKRNGDLRDGKVENEEGA